MPSIKTLGQLKKLFRKFDVQVIYLKRLAKKQDNDKNQIYLGTSLNKVANLIPMRIGQRGISSSTQKRKSDSEAYIIEGSVDFSWIGRDENLYPAPETKIIFYCQYPEARLSGFLDNCRSGLDALKRNHQSGFGKRLLFFGRTDQRKVVGLVLTEYEDPVVFGFPKFEKLSSIPVLEVISANRDVGATPRNLLQAELKTIFDDGWHLSQRLQPGNPQPIPFNGTQAGGYTLESLLGIPSNSDKNPDKHGYEIKSFSSSRVSLMTPSPDIGFQGRNSFRNFLDRYGKPSPNDPTRLNFNGTHKYGEKCQATGLVLEIRGYDIDAGFSEDPALVSIVLVDLENNEVAAGWSLPHFLQCWNKKHMSAVYIPTERRNCSSSNRHKYEYKYGRTAHFCEGTGIEQLLDAIIKREVVYDPGDTSKSGSTGNPKHRPQWRARNLLRALPTLYREVEPVEVL